MDDLTPVVGSTGWDRRLSVVADGKRLIGHAGAVLPRRCADRAGLTQALANVLPSSTAAGWRERASVLVHLAVAIVLGAANLSARGSGTPIMNACQRVAPSGQSTRTGTPVRSA